MLEKIVCSKYIRTNHWKDSYYYFVYNQINILAYIIIWIFVEPKTVALEKTLLEPLIFFKWDCLGCYLGQENSPGQLIRGSLQGDPCIIPGQNMGALPGSSVRGLGYRDTAAGLKYIPAVVAKPLIRGKPERSCPAVVMGLPKISLIPCGVPSGIWEFRLAKEWALKPAGFCRVYGNKEVFISVMLCSAASGVLPRTNALCRLLSICPTANIGACEPHDQPPNNNNNNTYKVQQSLVQQLIQGNEYCEFHKFCECFPIQKCPSSGERGSFRSRIQTAAVDRSHARFECFKPRIWGADRRSMDSISDDELITGKRVSPIGWR